MFIFRADMADIVIRKGMGDDVIPRGFTMIRLISASEQVYDQYRAEAQAGIMRALSHSLKDAATTCENGPLP